MLRKYGFMAYYFRMFALIVSTLLFSAALLAVCKPPTYHTWQLSVVVIEGGHFLIVPCLLLALWAWGPVASSKVCSALFLASGVLFSVTLLRAYRTAAQLEKQFASQCPQWKDVSDRLGMRRAHPLEFKDLFFGLPSGSFSAGPDRPAMRTLVYARADGRDLHLDYYAPATHGGASTTKNAGVSETAAPCVLVVHGGGWDGGARTQLPALNRWLADAGYAVAALEYRLAPAHRYPAPVADVDSALAYLRAHAADLGLDPQRFVILGRSAGGQIALQAAYTRKDAGIKGVIAFYAPADMVFGYGLPCSPWILDSRLLMEQYLGGGYDDHKESYVASSPVEHVDAQSPPTLLLHGRPDVLVSILHTTHMRAKLRAAGVRYFIVDLPWAPHGYDFVFRGPGSQISLYFIERFLASVTA